MIAELTAAGPVVTDGAVGTQLQRPGPEGRGCPDALNLSAPERVEQVARAYVEAGSQIIMTNTLGANRFMLGRYCLGDKVVEVNRAGAEIRLPYVEMAFSDSRTSVCRYLSLSAMMPTRPLSA